MARALVIGGTLFMGRALVDLLLERGDDVVIMHRGHGTPFGPRVDEIRCDRNDIVAVRTALEGRQFDVVYDMVYDWQRGTTADQVSAAATAAAQGLARYVFTSSVAVYPPGGDYNEDAPLVPSDVPNPYAAHKADSERALFALHRDRAIPVTTLRPAFVYGEHNPFDREAFFWDRLVAGRPILVPDDGRATMQWVYARDVARAAVLASASDAVLGCGVNLANYPPITQREFVEALGRAAGRAPKLVFVPREQLLALGGQMFQPPYYFGAYLDVPPITVRADLVRMGLGLELTPMGEGLARTYEWYQRQQRPRPDFSWEDSVLAATG